MKKKLSLVIVAVVLVVAAAVGGTLAWFTDDATAVNVVTFGNVSIDLTEPNFEDQYPDNDPDQVGGKATNVVPGDGFVKDATVQNTGKNDCYVRIKLDITGSLLDVYNPEAFITVDAESAGWTLKDGYYYYNDVLEANEFANVLNIHVNFPKTWGNEIADKDLKINVVAEAVQADNFDGDWSALNA